MKTEYRGVCWPSQLWILKQASQIAEAMETVAKNALDLKNNMTNNQQSLNKLYDLTNREQLLKKLHNRLTHFDVVVYTKRINVVSRPKGVINDKRLDLSKGSD